MPPELILLLVVLAASFTQGATGFGFGLLAMSVLPHLLGVRVAVPVVAVLGLAVCLVVLWRWRRHVDGRKILPLLAGEVVGVPLGVFFLIEVDERIVTATLGTILLAYGAGRLLVEARQARTPDRGEPGRRPGPGWGVLAGLFAGTIGGAFNTGGPPLILYATARRWSPAAFKANLSVVFLFNTVFQLTLLAARGALTPEIWRLDLIAFPAMAVGVGVGTVAAERLNATAFRRAGLALLVVFGVLFLVRTF